jgi:aromatic-L-amino-acid/L-tryptophan decarboxylase
MDRNNSPLHLSPEELKELAHQTLEVILSHHQSLEQKPVCRLGDWSSLNEKLRVPFPEYGETGSHLLGLLTEEVFSHSMLSNHPRFLGFIPSPSNFASVLVEALVAAYNPFMGAWHEASGPTVIELTVLDWMSSKVGFADNYGGQVTSGGTAANLIGLAAARDAKLEHVALGRGTVYLSHDTHDTIKRNLAVLGLRPRQIREVEVDKLGRMKLDLLVQKIASDRALGLHPFCCVGTAGTTNTGAVDSLEELAKICRREDLWLHVDAAYGGASLLTSEGKHLLAGIEKADTVVIDAHKWLFQPFEFGCILARDKEQLKDTFQMKADYTEDLKGGLNLSDYGLQLSRSFKALKLWFSLRLFGEAAFRQAVKHGLDMARELERLLEESQDWEVITPANLGIVTFCHRRLDDQGHRDLVMSCWRSGEVVVSSTTIGDRVTLRGCPINPALNPATLKEIVNDLGSLSQQERGKRQATN